MAQVSEQLARSGGQDRGPFLRILGFGALGLAELALIAVFYQLRHPLACAEAADPRLCAVIASLPARALAVLTLAALCAPVRWASLRRLAVAGDEPGRSLWAVPHVLGFIAILWPALAFGDDLAPRFTLALGLWLAGGGVALITGLIWAAPVTAWATFAQREGWPLPVLLLTGFILPSLTEAFDVFWHVAPLANFTFDGAAALTRIVAGEVYLDKPALVIGSGDFLIEVADTCSGVQGIAVICAILSLYLLAYWRELRFPRVLILFPIAILLSIALNILRIATLIWIGANVSPELAVNGFHSNAGWLLVTALAFGLIGVSRAIPALRSEASAKLPAPPPFLSDPAAARIVPFIALMASGLVASTFAVIPGLFYPARALAIGLALLAFLPGYRAIDWQGDRVAVAVGLAMGACWLLTRGAPDEADLMLAERLSRLSPENFVIWVVFRVIGTVLLVPIAEELFFRDYLLRLGWARGWPARGLALVASSVLFALLHDRWLAGFLSGAVLGLLVWRSGRLGPAVWAHVIANGVIAGWALGVGDWSVI